MCFAASCQYDCEDPVIMKDVIQMLDMVLKSCEGKDDWCTSSMYGNVSQCVMLGSSAMSILFDELCLAVKGKSIAPFIKDWIQGRFASR